MKVAILAGGLGTRLQEETAVKPKPLVEVGGRPILWHIMKIYAAHGFNEFVVALGYKGELVKDYFLNYSHQSATITVKPKHGEVKIHNNNSEDWTVHLLDTGANTETGGRVKRVMDFVGNERLMLTYGDGVSNIDIKELVKYHTSHGRAATVTAVRPPSRFGWLNLDGNRVACFEEKPRAGEGWINGGFFVIEPQVANLISGDDTILERGPLETLARDGELMAYFHPDFWHSMDTLRDVRHLDEMWRSGKAPWNVWDAPHVESTSQPMSFVPPASSKT